MRSGRVIVTVVLCLLAFGFVGRLEAARTVKGTVVSSLSPTGEIVIQVEGAPLRFKPAPAASIMRGQLGAQLRKAAAREIAPGDHVVAVIDQSGVGTSIKAYYARAQGRLWKIEGERLFFSDARSLALAPKRQVVLPDGKIGKVSDLKPGSFVICRVNPVTNRVWTVVATSGGTSASTKPASKPAAAAPPIKPVIRSVTYSAPTPLKSGDIITADLAGTPGGKATFEVANLIRVTPMREVSPGKYRATAVVPKGTSALDAPLIGRLVVNGLAASPVQAGRLLTVISTKVAASVSTIRAPSASLPQPVAVTRPPSSVVPVGSVAEPGVSDLPPDEADMLPEGLTPIEQPSASAEVARAPVAPVRAPSKGTPIIITSLSDGSFVDKVLLIRGTAEPDARVRVSVNYSNQRTGVLELSGLMTSQDLAVGRNGQFSMGPILLEGWRATPGLRFTITASYPDRADLPTVRLTVVRGGT